MRSEREWLDLEPESDSTEDGHKEDTEDSGEFVPRCFELDIYLLCTSRRSGSGLIVGMRRCKAQAAVATGQHGIGECDRLTIMTPGLSLSMKASRCGYRTHQAAVVGAGVMDFIPMFLPTMASTTRPWISTESSLKSSCHRTRTEPFGILPSN